ncbi:MAG: hypothetical protein WDW38_011471 [Sanguina aurantia]
MIELSQLRDVTCSSSNGSSSSGSAGSSGNDSSSSSSSTMTGTSSISRSSSLSNNDDAGGATIVQHVHGRHPHPTVPPKVSPGTSYLRLAFPHGLHPQNASSSQEEGTNNVSETSNKAGSSSSSSMDVSDPCGKVRLCSPDSGDSSSTAVQLLLEYLDTFAADVAGRHVGELSTQKLLTALMDSFAWAHQPPHPLKQPDSVRAGQTPASALTHPRRAHALGSLPLALVGQAPLTCVCLCWCMCTDPGSWILDPKRKLVGGGGGGRCQGL